MHLGANLSVKSGPLENPNPGFDMVVLIVVLGSIGLMVTYPLLFSPAEVLGLSGSMNLIKFLLVSHKERAVGAVSEAGSVVVHPCPSRL